MKDILINKKIKFFSTEASLYCSLLHGFIMQSHYSYIKDNSGIWEIDAQGHGAAYAEVQDIHSLMEIVKYVSDYLSVNITIVAKQTRAISEQRHTYTLCVNGEQIQTARLTLSGPNGTAVSPNEKCSEKIFCIAVGAFVYGLALKCMN